MSFWERFKNTDDFILKHIRKWWRPITCIFIAGTMLVHGIIIPLVNLSNGGSLTDLTGLSLLVTAIAGAFAVREWGKIKGLTDDQQ